MTENCTYMRTYPSDGVIFYAMNIGLSVFSAVISVSAVLLNSLVIASVVKTPSLQYSANILLCSLSASDLLFGIIALPFHVAARLTRISGAVNNHCVSDVFWIIYNASLTLSTGASQVQLCIMGLDRYKAVSDPFTYRANVSNRKTMTIIVVSWLAWIAVATITIFLIPGPQRKYSLSFTGVIFIVVPVCAQVATHKAMRRHNQQIVGVNSTTSAVALAREKKMAVTVRYVTGTIFGCLVVPTVAFGLTIFIEHEGYSQYGVPWAIMLYYLNTCINPLIYFLRHADMRAAAYRLLGH